MRKSVGQTIHDLRLPSIDGTQFQLDQFQGKRFMLSFFRFAACPFCNLRIHELVSHYDELGNNFGIVAIFDSPLVNLQRYAERHHAPLPILADEHNSYYREYGIERSLAGTLKGPALHMPSVLYATVVKGYWPTHFGGKLTTMPADFLIDEGRVIRTAYYGKDEGDHLSFKQVKAFACGDLT